MLCLIRAVIFDVDDTLTHTFKNAIAIHQKAAEQLGLRVPDEEEFFALWGKNWGTIVATLWPGIDFANFVKKFREIRDGTRYHLIEGALETIKELKSKGIVLGIVTSKSRQSLETRSRQENLDLDQFGFTFSTEELGFSKPDGKIFSKPLQLLAEKGISTAQALYVGDLVYDYQAARDAGLEFVAVLTGFTKKEDFLHEGLPAGRIIPSVKELPPFLRKSNLI